MNTFQMIPRIMKAPVKSSFFLLGPRGTGKTTWLKAQFPEALRIDLLETDIRAYYERAPHRLRNTIAAYPEKKTIIIDEIQRAPELLSIVHAMIEEKNGLQFILTGSSARKLRKAGVNLLGGRALTRHMFPFFACELGAHFNLEKTLSQGLLPLVWDAESPFETLKSYSMYYLDQEVRQEALVRNVGAFALFLQKMSFSHGSLLNTSNIARECGISRSTVDGYLHVLEDLLLSFTLPVFSSRAKRELAAHSKFYFFDAGVFTSLRQQNPKDAFQELQGVALEGLVAQHLRAWVDAQVSMHSLSFWRTRSGSEVDFVVYGPQGFWAIEVKNGEVISPHDLKSLTAFREDYPESKQLLLYRGKFREVHKDILCMPCEEFLKSVHPERPLLS